jgi:dihydrofolate reductase
LRIIIIAAISSNGVIGRANGEMPWHVKEEFQHFKQTTLGSAVIMGRKTFETLGKPLNGRVNIIVTRKKDFKAEFEETIICHSLDESINYCNAKKYEKAFVIGGGEIYKQVILIADEMILSFMKFEAEGEVRFPEIKSETWQLEFSEDREKFEIKKYVRKDGQAN